MSLFLAPGAYLTAEVCHLSQSNKSTCMATSTGFLSRCSYAVLAEESL